MSICYSATVHESMIKLSGVSIGSRDQNIDTGMKRRNCDYDQCQQFFNWFKIKNLYGRWQSIFYINRSFSVYGKDPVNCDQAGIIGTCVHKCFDDSEFTKIKIKIKDLLVQLAFWTRSITSTEEKNPVFSNPSLLLTRLAAIAEEEENTEQYLDFELTHRPEPLFKNQLLSKTDQTPLRIVLLAEKATVLPEKTNGK